MLTSLTRVQAVYKRQGIFDHRLYGINTKLKIYKHDKGIIFHCYTVKQIGSDQVSHVAQPHQGPSCLQATRHFDRIDKGMYFYTLRPLVIHGLCPLH